jgi:Na+-transporting NADH:ubiquinone oxidoreductase subunit F
MSEILLGSLVFTVVIMTLVLGVLMARRWLAPAGEVAIRVNEKELVGALGERLVDAFSRQGLHLPAACGGKGTCGQCAVHVVAGGGQALPTERARLTPGEIGRGLRLACQLVVREPLEVRVPEELLGVREWQCRVRSTRFVGTLMKEIVLDLPEGQTLVGSAGSYVQVRSQPYHVRFADLALEAPVHAEWERLGLLTLEASADEPTTRAYSLGNRPSDDDCAVLVVRIATPPAGAPPGTPPASRSCPATRSRWPAPSVTSSRTRATPRWSSLVAAPAWPRCVPTSTTSSPGAERTGRSASGTAHAAAASCSTSRSSKR